MTDPLPLAGVRVADLSRVLAGPFATMLLGDLGADVVKVEPPGGDESRHWGPPWWGDEREGRSAYFAAVNRNKRSIVLDLRTDEDRSTLHRLLARADLLVHNYRPRTARRLGLEADDLRTALPTLVVASVGGYPGSHADRPAYDLLAQAVSGLMSVTGEPDGPPMKVGVALLDLLAGLECAVGALAALVGRGSSGGGRAVGVDIVEAGVAGMINVLGNHLASGQAPRRYGNAHPNIVPYETFAARDGHLVVAVGNSGQFRSLLSVLGLEDRDGRYATNAARVQRRHDLVGWLASAIATWDRDLLVRALDAADVPAGPVNDIGDALAMMRAAAGEEWTQRIDGIELAPSPIRINGSAGAPRLPPPRLGEHTADILAELG